MKTIEEKVEWISFLHKQNLNGRETEDELFETGILAGIEETEVDRDEFAVEFIKWCENKNVFSPSVIHKPPYNKLLIQFKKEKGL